jgi:pimeloyl-ACP methyl ester carboxylesterase
VGAAVLGLALVSAPAQAGGSASGSGHDHDHGHGDEARCRELTVPVALVADGPADQTIAATLCTPRRARTVQVLLHGSTYDRSYWDFPYRPSTYSYVRAATGDGFATLNVDRIGYGASSHPPSSQVNSETNAFVVHQLVGQLRNGRIGRFDRVVTVGHSMGSFVALKEAAAYQDVDAVIATGMTHSTGPAVPALRAALYPSAQDPAFAALGLDAGYVTTRPGTRGVFYAAASTDPAALARDEALKSTASGIESADLAAWRATPPETNLTRDITAPVLFVVGAEDGLACDPLRVDCNSRASVAAFEQPYFPATGSLGVITVPRTGHSLNVQTTAPTWYGRAQSWLDAHTTGHR